MSERAQALSWAENHVSRTLRSNSEAVLFAADAFLAGMKAVEAPPVGVSPQPDELDRLRRENERLRELARGIVALSDGWDADGSTGPKPPMSWETVARIAMDYAGAAVSPFPPASLSPVEPTPNDTLLRNIRMAAAMGLSFGHQATPQPMERMVERKDKRLRQILTLLAEHGVTGSMLRAESNAPVEPTPEPPVHNDLCSWCLTQADHVAASEECYERNSQRGRSAPVSTGEPAPAVEREGMTAPKNECGKCRMLGSIGPCDEHGPLGVSPSPVLEPTPEPPREKLPTTLELSGTMPDIDHGRNCLCNKCLSWPDESVEPAPPTPAPCVWREVSVTYGNQTRGEIQTSCGLSEDADEMRPLTIWPCCPQCGHPLQTTR